jgi:hypothetical protein
MTPDPRTAAEALLAAVEKMTAAPWSQAEHVGEPRAIVAVHSYYESLLGLDVDGMAIVDDVRDAAGIVALRNNADRIIRALLAEVDAAVAERDAARALAFDAVGNLQHTLACTGDRAWNLDLCDCYVWRFEERLAALTGAKP